MARTALVSEDSENMADLRAMIVEAAKIAHDCENRHHTTKGDNALTERVAKLARMIETLAQVVSGAGHP